MREAVAPDHAVDLPTSQGPVLRDGLRAALLPTRSRELELMLACSRWPQSPQDAALVRRLNRPPLDWHRFLNLTGHHRLGPLVLRNLINADVRDTPGAILSELEEGAESNAYRCMVWLAEVQRLIVALEEKNIKVRVLKGLPLARLAFADIGLRTCGDIDLLVDREHVAAADSLLRNLGYGDIPYAGSPNQGFPTVAQLSPRRLAFYQAHWKDFTYFNRVVDFDLDLHWRCFRNSCEPGTSICAVQEKQWMLFGPLQVATLPLHENILYLCVHGALDGWLYLKSLADVAALLRPLPPSELESLSAKAVRYGVAAELAAALVLVREYFGYELSSPVLPREPALPGEKDRSVAHILKYAGYALSVRGALSSREDIPSLKTVLFELGLHSGLRYWWEILVRILFRPSMWTRYPLRDSCFALYALWSPVDWLLHHRRPKGK